MSLRADNPVETYRDLKRAEENTSDEKIDDLPNKDWLRST